MRSSSVRSIRIPPRASPAVNSAIARVLTATRWTNGECHIPRIAARQKYPALAVTLIRSSAAPP
jgi:hypothetical protein